VSLGLGRKANRPGASQLMLGDVMHNPQSWALWSYNHVHFLSGLSPPCLLVPRVVSSIWKAGGEMAGGPRRTTTFTPKLQLVPFCAQGIPAGSQLGGCWLCSHPLLTPAVSHLTAALAGHSSRDV